MALTANQDWLYKQMTGKNVDLGSEEQFAQAMQDESNPQWVYEQAGKMGIDLGTPEQFASAMQMPVEEMQAEAGSMSGGSLLGEQEELTRQNAIQGVTNDPNHPFVEGEKKQPNAFQTFYKGLGAGVINTANGLLGFLNRANSGRLAYDPVTLQQMAKQGMSPEEIEQAAQATRERLDNAETERYNAWKDKADQLSAEAKPDGGEKSFTDYIAEGKIGKALQLGLGTAAESLPYTVSALNPVATASMIMSMSEQNYRQSLIDNPDMSDGQRLASAAGNAAIEMAVEHIGNPFKVFKAGKLTTPNATKWIKQVVKESKDNIYKGILRVLGFGAKEAGKEGLEEVITTAGQDLYNTLLDWKDTNGLGLQSQWERLKEQKPDITPEEFAMYKAEGLTNDFIGGALSGMMMSGPSTGVGVARAAKYYSKNGGSEESRAQAQQQLAVLQQLATEFDVTEEEVAQAIVDYQAEKQLTPKQQALINRGEEIITNLQNAQSATQATEPQETTLLTEPQETTPLSPAAAEYRRAVEEVTQSVGERTHGNGYIYPVAMPGNAEKTGYIVGEVVPVIDESNPEQLKIENDDVVTVKWSDGTVTQECARDLDLTGAPMMAQQAIDIEVENQMYGYTQQRIQNGEQPVLMRDKEGILEGFFPTEGGLLEDQNGVQYTPEQLAEQGWQETKPVLFVNDQQQIAALDNGDGTYTQVDALGNPIAEPMSAEAFSEQGFAMVPLEEEQPKSQAPVEAPVVEQASVEQAPEVQQPEVQETAAPVVPNIETMSADELGGSAVEYMGDRASAMAYLEAERDKADAEVRRTSKLKVTRFNGPEDFKRQNDQIQAAKRTAIDRYNKLQNAITAANAYKTLAEQKEEAERKAREAALREQRRQLAEAETAGNIEAKWQNTKKTVGFAATKTLPNGQKVNGHYILTEAGDVVPSHDPRKNYADSEGYVMENGQNVNDNNYKDQDVQRIATDIAQNYGGQAVEQMPFLENKAGRVLSGNNRTISGIIAAENNTDQAYLAALAENAQQYGFTPEQLAEYQHPRLQFVVEDELPFTTATFAMFNQQEKKTKSSVNRAVANSKMVTEAVRDKMLEIMDQYESLDSFFGSETAASDIVQALITEGLMTPQEVAGLTENTATGFKFGQSGREYVTDMLLGTLFDEQTIKMLAGEKTLKQAILRALPSIVANRRLKGYELTDSINNAIQLLYEARKANEGKSTADAFQLYLRQVDAFKGSVMDNYNGFDIILANRMSAGVEQLREILGLYNNSAMNEANGQMGFFEPRTIDDIKQDVYEHYTNQQPELAAALDGAAATGAQPQSAVSSGAVNEGETRQEVKNSQENLQESEKSSTFAGGTNQWEGDFFDTLILSKEEKQALLNQIDDGVSPIKFVSFKDIRSVLEGLGISEKVIQVVENTLSKPGKKVNGFFLKGINFLNSDSIKTGVELVRAYAHERQHGFTKDDPALLQSVIDAVSPEEAAAAVEQLSGTDFYTQEYLVNSLNAEALADELIAHVMGEVYATGESVEEVCRRAGVENQEVINILNTIDNEQRSNASLSKSRRDSILGNSTDISSQQNGRDSQPQSEGELEREGDGVAGESPRGAESGGQVAGERGGDTGTGSVDNRTSGGQVTPTENRETTETKAAEIEIGGALVDRLGDMGLRVSTDLAANRQALKEAKADKSEAGTIHYFKTPSGKQYGFAYKGKVYLDPTKINAELPLHEYGHLWSEALRRLNPENWQRVVETIKADKEAWAFVRELRPELTDENEITEEVIATFSGKNGAEKMRAEYERMHGKDADYKSKWGNIFKNISKAIQDFWKAVGDFLNIKYTSAEQVYDQVLKDFVDNMNPWKRVSDYLQARDNEYVQAAESGDIKKATNLFYDALKENIGNGITPYMSVGTYTQLKRLAKGVKTRNEGVIKEAAAKIAPLIPDNAVLIPAPSHDGRATDMLDLAKAVAEITGSEVADVLRSAPRESQYQAKKATGVPMASGQLGITMEGTLPEGKTPIIIDNVVDSGNTAEACVQAVGRAVVVTIGDSAEQYRHAASLKSAAPVLRDKAGKVIPLSKRFEPKGSRYLGRRIYLSSNDPRFAISGTQVIPVTDKTLVGLHNISAEKLRKALKAGGLANPSAAVIDIARQNHHDYGEVSLVLSSNMVENADGTYAGDAWTPMYPPVEYRAGKDTEKRIKALTKGIPDNLASAIALRIRDYMDGNSRNSGMEYIYLKEQGRELPIEHTPRRYPHISIKQIADRLGIAEPEYWSGDVYQAYEQLPEDQLFDFNLWLEQNGNQEEIDKRKAMVERWRSEGKDAFANTWVGRQSERMSFAAFDSAGYRILRDERDAGEENTGMTLDKASYIVDTEGLRPEFETWLQQKIDGLGYEEVLFGGYTPSGNRRWLPNTVENASKLMNQKSQTNYLERESVNETKAMLMDKFRTLAQIRKHRDILEPDREKIKAAYEAVSSDWNQLGMDFRDYTQTDKRAYQLDDNPFIAIDTALARIQEAMFKADPIAFLNREYRYSLPADSEFGTRIKEMTKRIKNLPSRYFETKFRRPVYLNEFANAVVPNDLPQDLRAGLESAGLRLFSYDPNAQGSRRDATLKATEADGIRFSINGNHRSSRGTMTGHNGMQSPVFADIKDQYLREMADIKDKAIKDGTFMQAPNGKPSRLNERQWLQVRTENFKRWFGDWENDPENASKVLDENGEPMVVYHTSPNEFYIFDKSRIGEMFTGRPYDLGFYFTNDSEMSYGRNKFSVFLNIKDPLQISGDGWGSAISQTDKRTSDLRRWAKEQNNDGISVESMDEVLVENNSREFTDKVFVAFEPNQIKSATNNNGDFSDENDDIRFSISNQNNDIFYSNAERAVEGIKQEKATPEQWRAMIEKAGGLKAGEDKWIGLSDWLAQQRPTVELQPNETRSQYIVRLGEESKRFTISKQDILDYIREHKIQIEEVEYADELSAAAQERLEALNAEFQDLMAQADAMENSSLYLSDDAEWAYNEMKNRYGDDFEMAFEWQEEDGEYKLVPKEDWYNGGISDAALYYLGDGSKPINETRKDYTTEGLENKREIALTVPTIESWNQGDEIHFGDAGEGRAIAWVRFGDAWGYDEVEITHPISGEKVKAKTDKKVLVIDEIQSKRHQEGREKGYKEPNQYSYEELGRLHDAYNEADDVVAKYRISLAQKYNMPELQRTSPNPVTLQDVINSEEKTELQRLEDIKETAWQQYYPYRDAYYASKKDYRPTPAPFEKNWHELAMKRILRFAAENGYDKVAWTTGEQQAKRYDIGKEIDHIVKTDENTYEVYPTSGLMMTLEFDENGMYADEYDREYNGKSMSDIFGKELAKRLKEMPVDETLQGDGLRVGYDGMKGFYDDILPRFMQKYGKKWGVQVGEVTMPQLEDGYQTMHSVDITPEMRESVLQGQPMFSISGRGVNGTIKPQDGETRSQYIARVAETVKNMTPRNTSLDDAIRFSITVNHNSPYLLKRADGAFVDPETGERLGFDHRFMGKGEGGQAHGWGSYFSVNDLRDYAEARYSNRGKVNTYKGMQYDDVPKTLENFVPRMVLSELGGTEIALEMRGEPKEAKFRQAVAFVRSAITHRPELHDLLPDYYRAELADEPIDNVYSKVIRRNPQELAEEQLKQLDAISMSDFQLADRHHYDVEIPDNDGTNYFEEDQPLTQEQIDRLRKAAKETGIPKFLETISGFLRFAETNPEEYPFRKFYSDITDFQYGYPRETISNFLKDAGFTGIHYDGRRDGECYVIFDENDAKITDHIRFAVSGRGNEEKNAKKEQNNLHNSEKSSIFVAENELPWTELKAARESLFYLRSQKLKGRKAYVSSSNYIHFFNGDNHEFAISLEEDNELIQEIKKQYVNRSSKTPNRSIEAIRDLARRYHRRNADTQGDGVGDGNLDRLHSGQQADFGRDSNQGSRLGESSRVEDFTDSSIRFSIRKEEVPKKTGIGYKVFYRGKDGKLYPPMVANPNGEDTPVGVWLNADAAPVAGESKTGRPQVKAGGKGTQGGSGQLAYRPGWHLGEIPFALQFNRKDENGDKTLFPKDFVWAEVEYAADNDYQEEAMKEGVNASGKFQHSLAGLKHVPTDGFYRYRTNPNPETDPWIITGAMKVNRVLSNEEVDDIVRAAGREPQRREGDERSWKTVAEVDRELQEKGYSDESPIRFSVAYHGTGADFDKFLKSKINTGEGSQAFGWGLYFTDAKEIAEDYAKRQARQPKNVKDAYMGDQKLNPVAPETDYDCLAWVLDMNELRNIRTMNPDVARSIVKNTIALKTQELKDRIKFYEGNGATRMVESAQEELEYYRRAGELVREVGIPNIEFRGDRNLYTVSIPEDNGMNYFEWNAEIDERLKSSIIDGIVRRMEQMPEYGNTPGYAARIVPDFMQPYHVGGVVYQVGTRWLPKEEMSEVLAELGYKGIKYDAGTNFSQGVPDGAKNYVVFDDKDIEITDHIRFSISGSGTMKPQADETRKEYIERVAAAVKRMTPRSATIDDAIRFSITVNHNSPYLLKKADGSFVDPETGERLGFDHRFMGKGEGGQAHGWGSYFSVNDLREYAEARYFNRTKLNTYKGMLYDEVPKTLENFVPRMILKELGGTEIALAMQYATPESKFAEAVKFVRAAIEHRTDEVYHGLLDDYYRAELADEPIDNVYSKVIRRDPKELAEDQLKQLDAISIEDFELARRHHYTVSIPDNDGTNYLDEIKTLPKPLRRKIAVAVRELPGEPMPSVKYVNYTGGWRQLGDMIERNQWAYQEIRDRLFNAFGGYPIDSEKKLSKLMSSLGFVGVHYDGRRDGECYVIFDENDAVITDHIRFAISGNGKAPSSAVTEALVKQANDSFRLMQSALKKVSADLRTINAIRTQQFEYDRKVVDMLLDLYNSLLQENSVWAGYMPDTTRRIATQIVHAIGKKDISAEVNTIMDHMVHAQAKAAQRQWDKLRQTPIDKINISGVVMQGKVALQGQHALKAMNEALDARLSVEQLEDQIAQLMDMEDNATDESLKLQYKGQWIGYTIAAQHLERIQHLVDERNQLDIELQSARSNRAIKQSARQQLVANIQQAMRDNFIAQADAYAQSAKDLAEYVTTQEEQAKDFIHRQDANRDKIRSYAQRDLEGLATNPNRDRTRGNIARQIWDAFASPIRDLQSLLRLTGMHAPDGEGYLYNHFMRGWMDGADKERLGIVNASKTLDNKISELTHGKYKTWEEAARKIDDASHNMFTITMLNGVDGKDMPVTEEIPLNAGNALYIYAVNKMTDGRMKLAGMNITEEDVKALTDKVREQFGQEILDVVDWVQSEYFSQLRNRYNPTHEALFGAPMDAIENYFPLRINANARQQNEDLSEPDTDAARLLAGTSTGAIKRRTKNSLPLDVRNADFFQEVIRHISQMERWNAFAQWNRDANILFSDINFRNRIKGMNGTIYGSGDKLYNYMKDAFRVAIGTYKPKTDTFSEITLNIAKGVTSAKINFRNFTAIKQLASFPSFFTYVAEKGFLRYYMRNWMKPHETMKWAKENLPNFEKRVSKRDMGDMRLMQRTTDWQWNKRILELSSKYGMYFNVLFDTLTCATGARAVYDARYAKYIGIGYTQEDAASKARQDAEQSFNTSQQSSEGAFMSPVQMDRNLVTAALTVFRTSPIQYTRNGFYHARNLVRKYGRKDEMITFRAGQYKNEGMSEEKAMQAAEKDFTKSIKADTVGVTVYFAILGIFWRFVGQVPYLLFGDDDDKKKEILKDAVTGGGLVQPITGLLGGGIIESALDGNGSIADMFAPEMPFTQDIRRATDYLKNDKYAEFASQALSVAMQSGTGFDPQTAADLIQRIVTTIDSEEELSAAEEAIRVSQALLSIPQSQYEQQLIDRVVADESEYDAALADYIRYQKVHTAPLTWWLRSEESDEKAEENAERRFDRLLNERDNLHNPEDYEE